MKGERTLLNLRAGLHQRLSAHSEKSGYSISKIVQMALKRYLNKLERKPEDYLDVKEIYDFQD